MRGVLPVVACALALALGGCGGGGGSKSSTNPAKSGFIVGADDVCTMHLRAMMSWLNQPETGPDWRQQAVQDEGVYEIMSRSIHSLEALGPAPGPGVDSFAGYVKTLKARAALFRLTSVAFQHRDTVSALGFERRVKQIDAQGDRYAHSYGLRVCGSGLPDLAKAFDAAGWGPQK